MEGGKEDDENGGGVECGKKGDRGKNGDVGAGVVRERGMVGGIGKIRPLNRVNPKLLKNLCNQVLSRLKR